MGTLAVSLLVGLCCALCAAFPCWLLAKAWDRVEALQREVLEARRTIQNLNRSAGLTETRFQPMPPGRK